MRENAFGSKFFRVYILILQDLAHEAFRVRRVENNEILIISGRFAIFPEDPYPESMKSPDKRNPLFLSEKILHSRFHLSRGFVCKSHGKDVPWLNPPLHEIGDTVGEDFRLPRPRAGNDEERPFYMTDRLRLPLVKPVEYMIVGQEWDEEMRRKIIWGKRES